MTATVVIPTGAEQIFLSVENILDSFDKLQTDPKTAVSVVTGSTLTIGVQVKTITDAIKSVKEAAFFLKKEKPYWWDLRMHIGVLMKDSRTVIKTIREQAPKWVKAKAKEAKDNIEHFTSGSISAESLKEMVLKDLEASAQIVTSLAPLQNLGDELQSAFTTLFDLVTSIQKAYVQLRDGARKAKQFIERVFGPKAHRRFPRVTRTPGGGCEGRGFYPSTLQSSAHSEYPDDGADVLVSSGSTVVAPFPGIIYLSGRPNEVLIESRGGSPKGVVFVLTNVKANKTVKMRTDGLYTVVEVVAGQVIGQATGSPCQGYNHIHFAIRKGNGTVDPTRYLEPRFPEMPQWIQECDDYKYVYKGRTLAAGSIAGLLGRKPNDTSPERTPEPPKPTKIPASKNPSEKLPKPASQPNSVARKVKDNQVKAEDTAASSKDNVLKTLMESATSFMRQFNVKDMKMGSLVKFLYALDYQESLTKLTKVFQTIQAMMTKPCMNPNAMTDDALRTELRKQGKPTAGSREALIKAMTQRTSKCPSLSLGLPKQMHCTMDEQCLGLECCLDLKVAFFRKVYKMYIRLDPCPKPVLVMGLQDQVRHFKLSLGSDYGLDDIYGGGDINIPTGITIDALNAELYLKGSLEKEDQAMVLSISASVCQKEDESDCPVTLQVLDRAIMPFPVCGPDGTLHFPKVDLKQMLKNQKDKFKENGKKMLRESVTAVADKIFDAIPCLASEDNDHSLPCARPDAMSEETLTQSLQSRGLDTSGSAQERMARLEEADRTCTVPVTGKKLMFPPISNAKLAKQVYIKLNERCLGVDACVDIPINIPKIGLNYSRAVHASAKLDVCMPTFTVRFESCSHEILLFDNNVDLQKDYPLSDYFTLKTSVKKGDGDDSYTVGLGLKAQLGAGQPVLLDQMMVEDLKIPIPGCADFVLPGNGSLRELAKQAGNALSTGTVRFFLKALKLDTVLTEGTCEDLDLTPPNCPWNINVSKYLPDSISDNVTCVMTPNCLGITCCLDVTLKLPLMQRPLDLYLPFSFMFSPCDNMKISASFGSYSREEQLLNYEFGTPRQLAIGKGQSEGDPSPLTITFSVDHYRDVGPEYEEGFLLALNVRLCVPFDGQSFCFPDDGFDVMKGQKVPACSPASLAELRDFNLTDFLESAKQPLDAKSLTQSVSLILLNKFGITDSMEKDRCDLKRPPYSPASMGWTNECPLSTQYLPSLGASAEDGTQNVVCHLSKACNRVDCCFRSSFLNMNLHAWLELNCDLYLQAGLEKLVSPKLYVLGGEVDWKTGIGGEVNISEAFKIEYLVRKDAQHFILDADVKLCFDGLGGGCQLTINILKNTRIPQLGCNPNAISYFNDLSNWQKCVLPSGDTHCQFSLPASLQGTCVFTEDCQKLQCCVPVNLGFLGSHSISTSFQIDRCTDSFVYKLGQKSATLSLSAIVDVQQKEEVGNAITFYYSVDSHPSGYSLNASLKLCSLEAVTLEVATCFTYDVIPSDVSFYSPASHCTSARRRRKRQATNSYSCEDSTLSRDELMLHMIENEDATLEDIERCMDVFRRREEESRCGNQQKKSEEAEKQVFSPKAIMSGLGDKNPALMLFCKGNAQVTVDVEGGEMIFNMLSKVQDIKGRLDQAFIPGAGLTGKGAKALAFKVANMTIGEIQAYIMAEGVDPELAFQLMKDMKDLLYTLYADTVRSLTEGGADELFKSFDLTINGDFSVPRQTTNFFEYKQFFLVGGIVPMTFEFSAGITSGMEVGVGTKVMEMKSAGQLGPEVALTVRGALSIGALLVGKLQLTGYICEVSLPSEAAITFSRFPMDLDLTMDMKLTPLELNLAALVTLEINLLFETITKTLFKTSLFRYKAPSITKRVLDVGKSEPDNTPPKFTSFEDDSAGRRRRSKTTNKCFVRQLPGLDYTEPSVEIAVSASDEESQPTLQVLVGTSPGLQDLLTSEMGGPSTIIRQHLGVSAQPVYFTVKATNNAGKGAKVTCSLDTYDITLPQGRLVAEYPSTSNRHVLSGNLVVHEDSPLVSVLLAVGHGKGKYAGGVWAWTPVNLADRSSDYYDASKDNDGHVALTKHFTGFKEGRLVVPAVHLTRDTKALFVADCAKQCASLPESKCMSFNFHSKGHCELLSAIAGHDHHVAVAHNYLHYERLGVGLAHEFVLDVPMVHNSLYFFNLLLENSLQYINVISSEGTIVDLTPPKPGPMNITYDTLEIIPCETNVPKDRHGDWLIWCREVDPSLPNHRILHDGPGSATVFNGHERMFDLLYTKANRYVSANWDGIHDYESGVLGYSLTVGLEVCEERLHPHHDPHKHLVPIDDDEQWTHIGVVNTKEGSSLPDDKYYVTVRALNEVKNGGPLSTTFCHITPYVIDTSPPFVYEVYGTKYDEDTHVIVTEYNASDVHSDILQVALCLGRTVLNCGVLPWHDAYTENATAGPANITFQIPDGIPVWVRLRAENGVELQAVGHALKPIIVDKTPPLAGTVYDGPVSRHDLKYSKDQFQYCANWYNFSDPESGIAYYMGAVKSEAGDLLTNLTLLDRRSHLTCVKFDDPPLQHNHLYSFLLYGFNGGHKQLNVSAESDGVLVDLTPPVTGDVIDGLRPNFTDVSFSVHQATVAAQWQEFHDPESDVIQYEVKVERAENLSTTGFHTIKPWTSVELSTSFESHDFHLKHRDVVRTTVKATNGALNTAHSTTDSFIVDLTPPRMIHLWDGLGSADIQYQSYANRLDASFEFVDEESGLDHFKYQVFQTKHGHRTQIVPASRNTWVDLPSGQKDAVTVAGLNLTPGLKYFLRVAAVNQAGSVAAYDTDGVLVDPTPPVMDYVHVGVMSGEDEVLIDGYVLQSDDSGIKASWLATDHESGVASYQVSVGTSAGSTDVLNWQSKGKERDSYIGGLSLQVTNPATNSPLYYVSVRAINGAGDVSASKTSGAIKIVQKDEAGVVRDGSQNTVTLTKLATSDIDYQLDRWALTAQFTGFTSHLHGLRHFDWAVGTSPGAPDLVDFTPLGVLHDEQETGTPGNGIASRGLAHTVVTLQPGKKYYTTVRAFNNDGQALQAVSDGFTVDVTPPRLKLVSLSRETNSSELLPTAVMYQREADALSAEWTAADAQSEVARVRYAIGTHPGADNIKGMTEVAENAEDGALPSSGITLRDDGWPNMLTLWGENSVGLTTQVVSPAVVVDITPPEQGNVTCPLFIQPHIPVQCQWKGFHDAQSSIKSFTFSIGTAVGLADVMQPVTLAGYVTRYIFTLTSHQVQHGKTIHVSVTATNALAMTTTASSSPISIDTTPPVPGTVVELSDTYSLHAKDDPATTAANKYVCEKEEECLALDVVCQESMTSLLVAWSAFEDPETSITKYEVAVGTSRGGGQLRALEEVPAGQRFHLVEGLNLMGQKQIFATVKATNGAGASTTATSNGVFLSYLSQGLSPPGPVVVLDGDSQHGDLDYQTSLTSMSSRWTVEGDGCPAVQFQWAIERVDGYRVAEFYDTKGETSSLNDGLQLTDLETYYQLIRVTNAMGYTYTLRSDGITVHPEPLIPGEVYDGSKTGFDLSYQASSTKVSANWQGFGKQSVSSLNDSSLQTEKSGLIDNGQSEHQRVTRYEVAVGTDRRYDNTRDNVVPWTDVGLNTSVTFYDLTLTPIKAVYYFTVRAYSASNSRAEVTSNGFSVGFDKGVSGGRINMGDYVSSITSMEIWWDGFQSEVGMFIYYVALSSLAVDNTTCQSYTDGGDMNDTERQRVFDIADRRNTGSETYILLEQLNMTQDTDVYIHVIGVDRAGMCHMISKKVHTDVTPPVAGKVKCGPYYDMAMSFAATSTEVTVDWKSFSDAESTLTSFTLELMTQPICDVNASRDGDVLMSVKIAANYSSYVFRLADKGQSLTSGHPYFVRITAENGAGLLTNVTSAPLLFDDSLPVAGHVRDGADFRHDETWVGSNSTFKASILHLATPVGVACPPRPLLFDSGTWTRVSSPASWDNTGRRLDLVTQPNKAQVLSPSSVKVTLTRDTNQGHMYTATLLHHADVAEGGKYEVNILAADGDGNAVTSVTLWDGDGDNVIHYDFAFVVESEYCLCCFNTSLTSSSDTECMTVCGGCTSYVSDYQNRKTQAKTNNPPASSATRRRRRRSSGVQTLTKAEKERLAAGESLDEVKETSNVKRSPACGMQLYTLKLTDADYLEGARGRLVVWCTFGEDVQYDPKYAVSLLTFDPSAASHLYTLRLFKAADEEAVPTRCISVSIDGETVSAAELCGTPILSPSTRLALTVWNWQNFLTDNPGNSNNSNNNTGQGNVKNNAGNKNNNDDDDDSGINSLWQTSAIFSHVVIPAEATRMCRYGDPFRGGNNPVVRYEAAIGSNPGLADVVPFKEVNQPCLPCVDDCDKYDCNSTCDPSATLPLTLTLEGLDLPSESQTSGGEVTSLVYYFTVKAVLGSGRHTQVSSDGFSIDVTAPVVDLSVFFYLDKSDGQTRPVDDLMASNSTLQVLYGCQDNQSDIVKYEWAIGTTPGGQEVQNYTSTGRNPSGINDQLLGVITHNTRYYASFRCTNGAGLTAVYEDQKGIKASIEPLSVDDASGELQGTDAIGSDVVPATARQSDSANSVSVSLTLSQDPTVSQYYFSIGSTKASKTDDIFPRRMVAHNVAGVISIRDGNVYKNGALMFPLRGARKGFNGTAGDVTSHPSDFKMEPNRELFAFMDMCNEAQCTGPKLIGSVVVHTPNTVAAVSQNGDSVRVGLSSGSVRRRRSLSMSSSLERVRREEMEEEEEEEEEGSRLLMSSRVKRSASQVFVTTPSGLEAGQAVMLSEISHAQLTTTYDSVASTSFVSYLADPTHTLSSVDTVDRILAGRASYNPSNDVAFSLLSVGQIEMPGPVSVSFPFDPSDTESTVQLLHWNPNAQKWQRSADTCENETDTEVKDVASSTITVKVCNTYSSDGFFAEQTLFLLPSVNNTIPNEPPRLSSPSQATMVEDEGTLIYQVETDDAEGDGVQVSLDSPSLTPDEGEVILTPTNLVLFTPCADCSGVYELRLVLTEVEVEGIPPNTATTTLTLTVTPANDAPVAFLARQGVYLMSEDPTADVLILLEQNKVNETDYSYSWLFGSYDVDSNTKLNITVQQPASGTLQIGNELTALPQCSSSAAPAASGQDFLVPCDNMSLPHDSASLTWRYMTLTYRPNDDFYGYDTVRFLATDEGGMGSEIVTVKFAVMAFPCENGGTCVARNPDLYPCQHARRAENFDIHFQCNCSEGFYGLHCDGDTDDCLSNPCSYPYVCVDLVNAHACRCADDNPECDGFEGWMAGVIVIVFIVVAALVVTGVLIWAFRTGRLTCLPRMIRPGSSESRLQIVQPSSIGGIDNRAFPQMTKGDLIKDPLVESHLLTMTGPIPGKMRVGPDPSEIPARYRSTNMPCLLGCEGCKSGAPGHRGGMTKVHIH